MSPSKDISKLSAVLTTFNNTSYLKDSLPTLIQSDAVSEIVISDDASEGLSLDEILNLVVSVSGSLNPAPKCTKSDNESSDFPGVISVSLEGQKRITRVLISQNPENIGASRNKYHGISLASHEWVVLLDVDNILDIDSIPLLLRAQPWDNKVCYAPYALNIFSDVSEVEIGRNGKKLRPRTQLGNSRLFTNKRLGLPFFAKMLTSRSNYVRSQAQFFLNTGNFLIHREQYISVMKREIKNSAFNPQAADEIAFSARWLSSGNDFLLLEGFLHHHRVHSSSYWMTSNSSQKVLEYSYAIANAASCRAQNQTNVRHSGPSTVVIFTMSVFPSLIWSARSGLRRTYHALKPKK